MNGSILIPEEFKLKGQKITVVIDDVYCSNEGLGGEADFGEKMITLCGYFRGKRVSKIEREQTFYHELVHMILNSMARHSLKYNEDFVDEFAMRLFEYEKTKK